MPSNWTLVLVGLRLNEKKLTACSKDNDELSEFAGYRKNDSAELQEGLKLAGQQAVDDFARMMQHWTEQAKIPGRLDV